MKQFHIEYQHDGMQCGIVCLQMICRYFGKRYSVSALSKICVATKEGVSLQSISDAANTLGLTNVSVFTTLVRLKKCPLPCILHWDNYHFVVLYQIKDRRYYIADPEFGKIQYGEEDFCRHWICSESKIDERKGIAMLLEPSDDFFKKDDSDFLQVDKVRTMPFLWRYMKRFRKSLVFLFIALVVNSIVQFVFPFLTQAIVDKGIRGKDIGVVGMIMLGQTVLVISSTIVNFLRRWLLLKINVKMNITLISDFFAKLLRLPMSFFEVKLLGDLIQRVNDHDRINTFLTQYSLDALLCVFSFVVYFIFLLSYSSILVFVVSISILLYTLWMFAFIRRRKIIDYRFYDQQTKNSNKTYEFLTSIQEIKLQDCENRKRHEWETIQGDMLKIKAKSLSLQQAQEAGSLFIGQAKDIIITMVSAGLVINGHMTFGMMLAVQYVIGQLNPSISRLINFIYSIQDVKISTERIAEIHDIKDEDGIGTKSFEKGACNGDIRLDSVSFKYDPHSSRIAIDDISLLIPHGKVTALVGASGCGKTTLVKLLLGYYDVLSGKIEISGKNIRKCCKKAWRRKCGVVMQDGVIFSESIARNIAVSDGPIDIKRVEYAAQTACIYDFIMSLPLKFDTKIGRDGINFSQGQKQRILIARAVYKNPSYIFLDEATNSLDANNEKQIVENLKGFYSNRTVVIVAHRLSTIKDADQIVVMEHGKIYECGTHGDLISRHGKYYQLVKNQLWDVEDNI